MEFKDELEFAKFIKDCNGTAYLVGGAIRDKILKNPVHDKDYVITGIALERIPFENIAGKAFPVFLVKIGNETCEVALARKETKTGEGHSDFHFFTDKSVTIEEDLKRRDLTINSMAINILTNEFIDPFNGLLDCHAKHLQHTSEAFKEDPLRVFRVARFACNPGFVISSSTMEMMKSMKEELTTLSPERIWGETVKALESTFPSKYFKRLKDVGALEHFFPELAALDIPDKHDGTAFLHTMKVLDYGSNLKERFGLLVHDFGKGRTDSELHPSHFGHDKLGIEPIREMAKRLKIPTKLKRFGEASAITHMRLKRLYEMKSGKIIKLVMEHEKDIKDLVSVSFIDSYWREGADCSKEMHSTKEIQRLISLAVKAIKEVTGKQILDLGVPTGPEVGKRLFQERIHFFNKYRKIYHF